MFTNSFHKIENMQSASSIPIRSFAVTFRPLNGVTDEQCKKFVQWVKKHSTYYYVITEKTDSSRHIHAALFLAKPMRRSSLIITLPRLFPALTFEERRVFMQGIKTMYNYDWLGNYLEKGDDTVVLERNLPERHLLDAYFEECPTPQKKGPSVCDPYFANLENLWHLHRGPASDPNPQEIRCFLMDMMNKTRVIKVIADNRKIFALSCALSRYIRKETEWSVEPDPFHQDR